MPLLCYRKPIRNRAVDAQAHLWPVRRKRLRALDLAGHNARISGEMMVHFVEQRFGGIQFPREVQWLTENGSIFATLSCAC
jgi:hypothetical protein